MINKRYKDLFDQYIYKGEKTPLTLGTLVICALCFLLLIVATFTQCNFSHPWLDSDFSITTKSVAYSPLIPAMIFTIYILGKSYSFLVFLLYIFIGFFLWPIFAYGGGVEYVHNYLFGYFLGFAPAIFITGTIININHKVKTRLLASLFGVISIHVLGFIYCVILAIFKIIDFNLIIPILSVVSLSKIIYDILFGMIVVLIAPYIKNVFWVCMKPKADRLKNTCKRNQIIGNDVYQHWENYD